VQRDGLVGERRELRAHEVDVIRLTGEHDVSPVDVDGAQLMAAVRVEVVSDQLVDREQRVTGPSAHRRALHHVGAGSMDLPLLAVRFGERRQHVAEHDRAGHVAGAEGDDVQRMCTPEIAREMIRRWISLVPSKIV
jgi:hypothetical protein